MLYHTMKNEKINRKSEKKGKKRLRSRIIRERRRPDRKKHKRSDKMPSFFGFAIAFFEKCGIFCG